MEFNTKNTYLLLEELLNNFSIQDLSTKLFLHIGTIRRWTEKKEVPLNYYNDLNALLNYKYKAYESYRSKDQFYTSEKTAVYCFNKANEIIANLGVDINDYYYIEPSAGCCNFYNLLPANKRIGIDIDPKGENKDELIQSDYLQFYPDKGKKYIVLGNPPFGLRGNLALRFINHSAEFADFVAFILPPLFDSTGKGVPMGRVKGYKLIYSEKLPLDSYYYPNGETVSIATIFQVWSKIGDINLANRCKRDISDYVKIYSLSNGPTSGSKRNVRMIGKCDVYLPSTCFDGMKVYDNFDELPNKRGYGILVLKNKKQIVSKIKKVKWENVAFLSTNSALNLRMDLIIDELIKRKIVEEKNE